MADINDIKTYINKNGYPIIRRCQNCKHWKQELKTENAKTQSGYCKAMPMIFAFTLEKTVFPITKDFYLCESHEFDNEEHLSSVSETMLLKDAIKKKAEII